MIEAAPVRPKSIFGRILHLIFETSLLLKAIFAGAEIACGAALALVSTQAIVALAERLTLSELSADPHDLIAGALLGFAQGLSVDAKSFSRPTSRSMGSSSSCWCLR